MQLSVIIPCYNLENYIERCLNSVMRQTLEKSEYEIIVVFDSCTDGSERVAERCLLGGGVDFRFFRVALKSAGLARNVGLEAARGRFVYF